MTIKSIYYFLNVYNSIKTIFFNLKIIFFDLMMSKSDVDLVVKYILKIVKT